MQNFIRFEISLHKKWFVMWRDKTANRKYITAHHSPKYIWWFCRQKCPWAIKRIRIWFFLDVTQNIWIVCIWIWIDWEIFEGEKKWCKRNCVVAEFIAFLLVWLAKSADNRIVQIKRFSMISWSGTLQHFKISAINNRKISESIHSISVTQIVKKELVTWKWSYNCWFYAAYCSQFTVSMYPITLVSYNFYYIDASLSMKNNFFLIIILFCLNLVFPPDVSSTRIRLVLLNSTQSKINSSNRFVFMIF